MDILDSLNPAQREAAEHIDHALLILAGAGSGKTKTLTTRLCYMIKEIGIPAQNTLTLTFTNKAAKEMQERTFHLLGNVGMNPLLCTFHKFGLLFLRQYIYVLRRSNNFNIIDENDKRKIIKDIRKRAKQYLSFSPSAISEYISLFKNDVSQIIDADNILMTIYEEYNLYLAQNDLLDFDDLLLLPYEILNIDNTLRESLSRKYNYIMVDEYQDTNDLQLALLKQLCSTHDNICVVGDDDQSIYGWRGANIRNILDFKEHFKDAKIIKLEQNYRSTRQILDIANNLISHNKERHDKILKPIKPDGREVTLFTNTNDRDELNKIVRAINDYIAKGNSYGDIAILFRLNALSSKLESAFINAKIPYKMIGTYRFYERAEVKDVMAYLRYAMNPSDEFSLSRIINNPKRSIGEKTFENLINIAAPLTIHEAYKKGLYKSLKCYEKLESFFSIIEDLLECIENNPHGIFDLFNRRIKLYHDDEIVDNEDEVDNETRRENIRVFFDMLMEHVDRGGLSSKEMIVDFLGNIALSSSSDESFDNNVVCMSIHNSKGLEFKYVFVIGLEEGLFPLDSDERQIPEERRLAYVAFTRAKDMLTLSFCENRFYRGKEGYYRPSRFLSECGIYSKGNIEYLSGQSSNMSKEGEIQKGDCVNHKVFGYGRVESISGSGEYQMGTINFGGTRRVILLSFLQKV